MVSITAAVIEDFHRSYRFCHRRIREHLCNYVPKADFERYSLRIAQLLVKQSEEEKMPIDQVFELLKHFENSSSIITNDIDLLNYAKTLHEVGFQKGTLTSQHIQNFSQALEIANKISIKSPEKQVLVFKINAALSKVYIRDDQLDKAEKLLKEVDLDNHGQRTEWTSLIVQLNVAKGFFEEAIDIGLNSNSSLGFVFQALSFSDPIQNLQNLSNMIKNRQSLISPATNISTAQYAEEMIQNCIHICKTRNDKKNKAIFIMMVLFYFFD